VIRRSLIPLIVSSAVTLLLLFMAEIGVRVAGLQPMEWPGIEGKIRLEGMAIDPLLGPGLRPGWSGRWPGQFTVEVDGHGFRSSGLPPPPSSDARVAIMGDSCSFGWGLDTPETFAALLDARQRTDRAPSMTIWNAAYPGTSAVAGAYVLRERVLPLAPDVVILGFSANNAFRFADTNDASRFGLFELRKLLFRSRLWSIAAAWLANRNPPTHNPRQRSLVLKKPLHELVRVATLDEFTAAIREMVADARAQGAQPIFLIFPRASTVSKQFPDEDSGVLAARLPAAKPGPPTVPEINLLEASCLDHRALSDPLGEMRKLAPAWRRVYPDNADVRSRLSAGAIAYTKGDYAAAVDRFKEAVAVEPDSPLARYDLGTAYLASGHAEGMAEHERADRVACNVFLRHQVTLWRLARELNVPVVDLTLHFQAQDGTDLFMDPAHPNAAGSRVIADALWPVLPHG
jgi:lysophospholipase L1-like esterase